MQGGKDDWSWVYIPGEVVLSQWLFHTLKILTSKVGGLMGLCLGFSFLSFIELVYWFTYRMAINARN